MADLTPDPTPGYADALAELDSILRELEGLPPPVVHASETVEEGRSRAYVVTNTQKAPFNDARVRKAIALAMDREHITQNVLKGGQIPAYSFVPGAIANYTPAEFDWKSMPRPERLKEAKALLEEAHPAIDRRIVIRQLANVAADAGGVRERLFGLRHRQRQASIDDAGVVAALDLDTFHIGRARQVHPARRVVTGVGCIGDVVLDAVLEIADLEESEVL